MDDSSNQCYLRSLDSVLTFESEEVESDCNYPENYFLKPICEQLSILKFIFPQLHGARYNKKILERALPEGAEGWFAVPKWRIFAPTYREAIEKVFSAIENHYGRFYNFRARGELTYGVTQYFRSTVGFRKINFLEEQKNCDINFIPAQFGKKHRGRSVRRVRALTVRSSNEFPLGVFAVGMMLITHIERLSNREYLSLNCAGDELWIPGEREQSMPFIYFNNGAYCFDGFFIDKPSKTYGSPTGFFF